MIQENRSERSGEEKRQNRLHQSTEGENVLKTDHYKSVHCQWTVQHQMKDNHNLKIMALMAERDNAIQERNLALAEKRVACADRDVAIVQRDAAIAERNAAIMERDNALEALEYARTNSINGNGASGCPTRSTARVAKTFPQLQPQQLLQHPPPQLPDSPENNHAKEMHLTEAYPSSTASHGAIKGLKAKRSRKETQVQAVNSAKKVAKASRKGKRVSGGENLNKLVTVAIPLNEWRGNVVGGEDLNKQFTLTKYEEWKDQDLGLNQVPFDESMMPPPGCSCTGRLQQCYKWGNGGWQSACCTTNMSMYPLPVMPNKRHARVAGRKMSGGAFTKLLSRLAAEGHDLSTPVDLKDHWAKHGTNRYITIR
ncbi:hypothetical protein HPP92_026202 [Vanilla planifolia]|uniref:GAGA-binding transcriptional activator n=1 Tax=Vanilla planifolia TaxID=51239 RepID=A0A835PDX1_VANPL|nr:hypothetical protein HPP92_026202 [Vanilla planifolia]